MTYKKFHKNKNEDSVIFKEWGASISYYFLNGVVFFSIPFLLIKFNENPNLIIVLLGILILVILPLNYIEYFLVENDKLIVIYKKIFFLQFLNRRRIFIYDEIDQITITLKLDQRADIASLITNFTTKIKFMPSNVLEVEMKNGKKKSISTEIYANKLLPIIKFIQSKGVEIKTIYPDKKVF